jgi:diguanylate cyclase (GGDEF)-like protein
MDESESLPSRTSAVANAPILASTVQADRRQWWLWSSAISISILLALGIASFALPVLFSGSNHFYTFSLSDAARGLLGLVLIFNFYVVYEQIQIHRIRREFSDRLYQMAVVDPVTEMFNRRYIMQRLHEEVARCQRNGSPLTVMAMDLDCFKRINDEHGHNAGDYVLRIFGDQLKRSTRGSDVVARYGGDEFLAILPDCNKQQIQYVLNRLNGLHAKTTQTTIDIRYSAGWTDYIPGESVEDLLKRADELLYANKRNPKGLLVSSVVAD